jgi:hypothetical protein
VGEPQPLLAELVVGQYAADHVPALERRRVVESPPHHELASTRGPRPLRHALGAPGPGGEPDHSLHQAEACRLGGPDQIAAERDLESRRQAQAMYQRQRRDLERLEPLDGFDQRGREARGPLGARLDHPLERVHVDPAGEDLALGPPHERPCVGAGDLADALVQRRKRIVGEQVEGRVLEHDRSDQTVPLQADRARRGHQAPPPPAAPAERMRSASAAISSVPPSRGIQGSSSGSSS